MLSDDQAAIQNDIGADPRVSTNLDIGTDDGTRTDHHTSCKLGARIDNSEGVDLGRPALGSHNSGTLFAHHRQSTSENINSPEQTS
ncbi:UDP-N-acetylglucosamine acyltransferase [Synechococcus sp. WH 7805]|nr:UDP-N-acetylglucosamine acyltransferase [Synechococcus sp. WH 7805]